ncbi:RidA family protein [Paracoccus aminophilus]|uniref:Endoribonuclease L-PSP n=1 Tax=Paracoccus aminophilus JCM 7686 TaxID=1367847 RepID=S5YTM1_PARAH|nr:RidA family protein [Paracoccus aminophilus]AGT08546.1 endoribonuclease L-PSP [Paracoccus aminophilus JCM 7686]
MSGAPVPQGRYLPATRHGGLIFTSGMTPRAAGVLKVQGPVRAADSPEDWREAVELACANALTAARGQLHGAERITAVVSMTVFVAAEAGFTLHSKLADLASDYLFAELGAAGIGSRAAVGVATLPGGAPVEIQIIAAAG